MNKIRQLFKNKGFIAFLLSFLLGSLIVVPNIVLNKGIYTVFADFNVQQIPFNKMINYSLKEGSFLWTWYNELGSNMIGSFSFYNMFSPFNIICYLFPSSWFEYLIGPMFILKYAISGLTAYLFLKRYVKNKDYAILGSLLYSFSGFQLTNIMFYHFHDAVAFFPLLLYSLDNLVYDNKKGRFAIIVALSAFTNWFFFIGECIFLLLYFIVKVITKEYKISLKKFIEIAIESLIGVGMAFVVLLPSALFTIDNPRLDSGWTVYKALKHELFKYINLLKAFILPSEVMRSRSMVQLVNFSSTELYLPVVGSILAFSYFWKNKKNWISILMFILGIFMFIPILNSSFILFQTSYYSRWFYMATLILVLMSIKCLEEKNSIMPGILIGILFSLTLGVGLYLYGRYVDKIIENKNILVLIVFFAIINLLILCIFKNRRKHILLLTISVFVYVTIWGNLNLYYYKEDSFTTPESYYDYLDAKDVIKIDNNVRTNSATSCYYNYGFILNINNIKNFNSNVSGSSFEFFKSLDYDRNIITEIAPKDKELNDFLGVKYFIDCNELEDLKQFGYIPSGKYGNLILYENPEYKEFGFALNDYINIKEFNTKNYDEKINILNNKVVLTDEQIRKYKYLFKGEITYNSNKFSFKNNGFESIIDSNNEALAIYTIPYDKGFSAKINGKDAEIEKVDNGFMAIKINKGLNKIEFKYMTPGLIAGFIVSVVSLILYILYLIFNIKEQNQTSNKVLSNKTNNKKRISNIKKKQVSL